MPQSMSRVAKCMDNGPMEGFRGIIKGNVTNGKRFTTREPIIEMIENYIECYNNRRIQRFACGIKRGCPEKFIFF